MTREIRTYLEIADILGLDLECQQCHTHITVSISEAAQLPTHCPNCRRLMLDREHSPDNKNVSDLLEQIRQILSWEREESSRSRAKIRLLVSTPEEK